MNEMRPTVFTSSKPILGVEKIKKIIVFKSRSLRPVTSHSHLFNVSKNTFDRFFLAFFLEERVRPV